MKTKKEVRIFTNEEDLKFPEDPTDVEYLNNSVDSESSDEKFIEYLKTIKSFDLPKSMMENVQRNLINSYRKENLKGVKK